MPIEPFVLIVADHDSASFRSRADGGRQPVVKAGRRCSRGGKRHINCFVPGGPSRTDVETAAREYQREYGYARVEAGSIVSRNPAKVAGTGVNQPGSFMLSIWRI
jgi:hypothetical protein